MPKKYPLFEYLFYLPRPLRLYLRRILAGKGILGRLADKIRFKIGDDQELNLPDVGSGQYRVLIGPDNTSGQAYNWMRSLERYAPDLVSGFAINGLDDSVHKVTADLTVDPAVFRGSRQWQKSYQQFLLKHTHVVFESCYPMLNWPSGRDINRDIEYLKANNIRSLVLFHGSDIRSPKQHLETNKWSPFNRIGPKKNFLEDTAQQNQSFIQKNPLPVGVSTPDLLDYVPGAKWVPLTIDTSLWQSSYPVLTRPRPIVLHIPTSPILKGSDLIDSVMQKMHRSGLIEYRRISGVTHGEVKHELQSADIVLDQFSIGSYGVVSCEAMASSRLAIANVPASIRQDIQALTNLDLPIVQADPETIETVILDILRNRQKYLEITDLGLKYVTKVHNGEYSAKVLMQLLADDPGER